MPRRVSLRVTLLASLLCLVGIRKINKKIRNILNQPNSIRKVDLIELTNCFKNKGIGFCRALGGRYNLVDQYISDTVFKVLFPCLLII